MKHLLFSLLCAAFFVAILTPQNIAAQENNATKPSSSATARNLIKMEAFACRGYCPVYQLTFRKDGFLVYNGVRNVETLGPTTVRITSDEYAQLLKEVNKVDLWKYEADIQSPVVDAPVHSFTIFDTEKLHTVKGRGTLPAPVFALEKLMQDIAEAHGLPVRNGTDPDNPGTMKGQLIVKFKMDVNAKEFCSQFTDLKVRIIRHLSEDNTWVIGYNPDEISEEQFSGLLKDIDGVLTVEPNKQVKTRN